MNEENSYLIKSTLERVKSSPYINKDYHGHTWAKPNSEHLSQLMKHIISNREEAKAKAKKARLDMITFFDNSIVSRKFIESFATK